jgi:hypothetical protein
MVVARVVAARPAGRFACVTPGRPSASVRILEPGKREQVPQTGAARSTQRAEVLLPAPLLEELWKPEYLERLARAYWAYLSRISLGVLRVVYEPQARTVVLLSRRLPLLRFHAPEYETEVERGSVTWRIDRGLLVSSEGEGRGFLRILVERCDEEAPAGRARLRVASEVRNFYPWLRGRGRFARFGTWLYSQTQLRIHVLVTNGFLRSLARLDLPPSRVGSLRGEIAGGGDAPSGPV